MFDPKKIALERVVDEHAKECDDHFCGEEDPERLRKFVVIEHFFESGHIERGPKHPFTHDKCHPAENHMNRFNFPSDWLTEID